MVAMTEEDAALVGVGTASVPIGYVNKKDPWIDRVHNGVFNAVWRSAMTVDQWFGSTATDAAYRQPAVPSHPHCSTTSSTAFTQVFASRSIYRCRASTSAFTPSSGV